MPETARRPVLTITRRIPFETRIVLGAPIMTQLQYTLPGRTQTRLFSCRSAGRCSARMSEEVVCKVPAGALVDDFHTEDVFVPW